MSGHTPGPWFVAKGKARRVCGQHGVSICNAIIRNQGGPKAKANLKDEHEAEANAALIAAAPDLLEALEQMVAAFTSPEAGEVDRRLAVTDARAALARATAVAAQGRG